MKLKSFFPITVSAIFLAAAPTDADAAERLTPEQIYGMVDENKSLSVIRQQAEADAAAIGASNFLPGPEAEFEHLWSKNSLTKWSLGITQNFDWPGVYGLRRKMQQNALVAGHLGASALKQQLRYEATVLMTRIAYGQRRIETLNKMIADMESFEQHIVEALEHGQATILDRKKVAIEIVNLKIERDTQIGNKTELIADLSALAGSELPCHDSTDWTALTPMSTLGDLDAYIASFNNNALEYQAAKASLTGAELAVREASSSSLPGFGVGYRHEKEESGHYNGFAVTVSLPSWGVNSSQRAARMQVVSEQFRTDYIATTELARIRTEYDRAVRLRDNLEQLNRQGLDGSYASLLKEALLGGEITMLDYLREVSWFRETSLSMVDLEEQYALVLASLNRFNP